MKKQRHLKPLQPANPRRVGLAGFTLLELLSVVGIIGVLAGLLLPAVAKTKSKSQTVFCSNNQRQLNIAWMLYAGDNQDSLAYNFGAADTWKTVAEERYLNWVNNVMSWELDSENTNTALVAKGGLGPYCGTVATVYK